MNTKPKGGYDMIGAKYTDNVYNTTTALGRAFLFLENRRNYLLSTGSEDAANELTCALYEIKSALSRDIKNTVRDGCRNCHRNWDECEC